jgi:diguanylate cyclase (GGDEF)-like protein
MKQFTPVRRASRFTFTAAQAVWPALLVLMLGLVVTGLLWRNAQYETEKLNQAKLDARAQEIQSAIQTRMVAYEQILRGGVSLLTTLDTVTRAQWAAYVTQLNVETNFPGVHGIGYAQYVPQTGKAAFVQGIRTQGLPGYGIRPEGEREAYVPVTYLEPRTPRNLNALGFDMLSESTRQAALTLARDTGQPTMTGRLKLAAEPDPYGNKPGLTHFGFLVYLPVYYPGLPTDTVEQRRVALRGFVNSPFRINDLMRSLLGRTADNINLRIYDGAQALPTALMHDQPEVSGQAPKVVQTTTTVVLYNHTWTLVLTTLPSFSDRSDTSSLLLLAGVVTSLLLGVLTLVLSLRFRSIRHSEQHYFKLSYFDSLTTLPNRTMFNDRLERNLQQAIRGDLKLAVLFVDVDHFKAVNDNLGHDVGDALLKEVAARMQSCVRKVDTVARLGGDEFTVILNDLQDPHDAGKVAQTMLNKLSLPFTLDDKLLSISVSIGISLYPSDATEAADLVRYADFAMYEAKQMGRGQFQYYSETLPNSMNSVLSNG